MRNLFWRLKARDVFILAGVIGMVLLFAKPLASEERKFSVQELLEQCKNIPDNYDRIFCISYITGVTDAMSVAGDGDLIKKDFARNVAICGNATYGARRHAFINWAKANPQLWHWPRIIGVMHALREAWPCPSAKKGK